MIKKFLSFEPQRVVLQQKNKYIFIILNHLDRIMMRNHYKFWLNVRY